MRLKRLDVKNYMKIRIAQIDLGAGGGVTSIVGRNGQGKSSLFSGINVLLRGMRFAPTDPIHHGAKDATIRGEFTDPDLVVERTISGGRSELTVMAAGARTGMKSPQDVLDRFISPFAYNPLEFERAKPHERVSQLARISGVDLVAHEAKRKALFDERTVVNRQLKAAQGSFDCMPQIDAPDEPVLVAELVQQLTAAQASNAHRDTALRTLEAARNKAQTSAFAVEEARKALERAETQYMADVHAFEVAQGTLEASPPLVDTAPIATALQNAEATNARVRAKQARNAKLEEVRKLEAASDALTQQLADHAASLEAAIANAKLPVAGLTFDSTDVKYRGVPFDQASSAERVRVSVALGIAANPDLKLMLIPDYGSLLDEMSMAVINDIAEAADVDVLIERVDDGRQPGIVIEDGVVAEIREAAPVD